MTGDLLAARPDLVARVLARTLRAAEWSSENPVEAARIVAAEVGLAEELTPAAFSPDLARQLTLGLESELVAALASQRDLLLEHGFLAGPVDLDAFIAAEPLAAAHRLLADDAMVVGR